VEELLILHLTQALEIASERLVVSVVSI